MTDPASILAELPRILADGNAVSGLIFFAIWVLVAIVSALQQKKKKRPPTQGPDDWTLPQPLPPQQTPQAPPATQRRPGLKARSIPANRLKLPPKLPPQVRPMPPKLSTYPAHAPAPTLAPTPVMPAPVIQRQAAKPVAAPEQALTRPASLPVVLRPNTVRQGLILSELLRPPLALREEERAW